MKRFLISIISFMILSSTTSTMAVEMYNSKTDDFQNRYDEAYASIDEIVTGDEVELLSTSYEEANKIWIKYAGVDFDVCFDTAFNEAFNDINSANRTFDEFEDFTFEEVD